MHSETLEEHCMGRREVCKTDRYGWTDGWTTDHDIGNVSCPWRRSFLRIGRDSVLYERIVEMHETGPSG